MSDEENEVGPADGDRVGDSKTSYNWAKAAAFLVRNEDEDEKLVIKSSNRRIGLCRVPSLETIVEVTSDEEI
jgi:hypothetical protein